jgi:hypothetical protein
MSIPVGGDVDDEINISKVGGLVSEGDLGYLLFCFAE